MNHTTKLCLGLLVSVAIMPMQAAKGQGVPAVPGVPVAAPAPANLWSFLCLTPEQKARCKTAFCNSPLGQMASGMAGPMSAMSGGLIPNRCLQNSIENALKKPADSEEGAAARVLADEAAAKERRKAVRFLGTVDCNYWPEAVDALRNALRKDRNECVRFEAALALQSGCCCNATIVEALKISVMGTDTDGAPPERSDRVRAAAADALVLCVLPVKVDPAEEIKKPAISDARPTMSTADYYKKVAQMPREQVVSSARNVLVNLQNGPMVQPASAPGGAPAPAIPAIGVVAQRPGSVAGILNNAFSPTVAPVVAPVVAPTVAPMAAPATPRQPIFNTLTKSLSSRQDRATPDRMPTPPDMGDMYPIRPTFGIRGIVTQPARP